MPLIDSRVTTPDDSEFVTTPDNLDYVIAPDFATITEAAWEQGATWDATGVQSLATAATFDQDATWAATTSTDAAPEVLPDLPAASGSSRTIRTNRFVGLFEQSATWTARTRVNDDELVLLLAG